MDTKKPFAQPIRDAAGQFKKYGLREGIRSTLWKTGTLLSKRWIGYQDRLGLLSYRAWLRRMDSAWQASRQVISSEAWVEGPEISVVILGGEPGPSGLANLERTVHSLQQQSYPRWEARIDADQAAIQTALGALSDLRIHPYQFSTQSNALLNVAVRGASGEWLIFLRTGDTLSPGFFESAIAVILGNPETDLIYWDEDQIAADGHSSSPWFKPDWSPELLLSVNYLRHGLLRTVIGLDALETGFVSMDDFIFRAVEAANHIVHIPQLLIHTSNPSTRQDGPTQDLEWLSSVRAHLERMGITGPEALIDKGAIHVAWPVDKRRVSVIIPTRNNLAVIKRCLESILSKTNYPDYEVILLDTGSNEAETLKFYDKLTNLPQVHLRQLHEEFNYSHANNVGVGYASGEVLVFLNNDVEIITGDWLEEMVRWISLEEVGVVGGKLLYPDGGIQHAGIVLGMEGHASHVFSGAREGTMGIFGSTEWYRDVSAVTGACMALRREVFEDIGGFDEAYQLVFSDIDICLKAIEKGYRVVYNPFIRLVHYEGKSRGNTIPDQDIHLAGERLEGYVKAGDRYYNPNLSRAVRLPTLRRFNEEDPSTRLKKIVRWP